MLPQGILNCALIINLILLMRFSLANRKKLLPVTCLIMVLPPLLLPFRFVVFGAAGNNACSNKNTGDGLRRRGCSGNRASAPVLFGSTTDVTAMRPASAARRGVERLAGQAGYFCGEDGIVMGLAEDRDRFRELSTGLSFLINSGVSETMLPPHGRHGDCGVAWWD